MKEIWKDIQGYEGVYQVSNLGKVKSLDRTMKDRWGNDRPIKGRILKFKVNFSGYHIVHLRTNRESHPAVHRLVAETFLDNPENKPTVNHIDCCKTNNSVDNLEWSTHKEQMRHAFDNNLCELRGKVKYSSDFKKEIYDYYFNNEISIKKLSKKFNISEITASRIVKGEIGQHQDLLKEKEKQVPEIQRLRKEGKTYKEIGDMFGIGISQTKRICDGESRKG